MHHFGPRRLGLCGAEHAEIDENQPITGGTSHNPALRIIGPFYVVHHIASR
jgi:hypothetical protein